MSSKGLPLQTGLRWREAEEKATVAARHRKVDDIAESYRLWERLADPSTIARTHLKRGDASARKAEYALARTSYETALTDCRRRGDVRCIAEAANNSGLMALQMGDSPQSSSRLQEAAKAWRATGLAQNEGITLSNLGLLLWQTADFQGAISYFTRARAILQPRDAVGHSKVLNNLGLCYESLGEFALARTHYESAVAGFLRAKIPSEAAKARVNLGRTYLIEKRLDQAESFLRQALSGAAAASDRATVAAAQANLGQVLLARHLPDQATAILREALAAHRELRDKRFQALEHHHLGLAARERRETGPARASLREAAEIRLATGFRDAASDSLFALAELERDTGNLAASRTLLEQAIQLSESTRARVPGGALRASFYARKRRLFDLLVDLTVATGTPALSLVSAERGRSRALLDLLGEGSLLRYAPADLVERRRDTQQRLDLVTHLLSRADGAREADLRRQVDELLAEDAGIEASIRQTLPTEKPARPLGSIEELSQALPGGTALLEYHLGERASYLWIVTRTLVQVFPLPSRAEIEARTRPLIEAFGRAQERKRSTVEAQQFARDLDRVSEALLGPLKAIRLPARVVIAPDGILARVPFAALRTPSGGALGLDHDLSQVVSASHLVAGRKPRRAAEFPRTVLALADPVFSARDPRLAGLTLAGPVVEQNLARLPFHDELTTFAALVPPTRRRILLGLEATIAGLQSQQLAGYAIIHLATHAAIDDRRPELSQIVLSVADRTGRPARSLLRANELAALALDGSTVVLSACDTALGKETPGEGLTGFTSALFQAGAAQLVLSLAKIDAEAASLFLSKMYGGALGTPGFSNEHAVRLARIALAESARWRDPYYWASIVIYGRLSATE